MSLNLYRLRIKINLPDRRFNRSFILDAAIDYIASQKVEIELLKRENVDLKSKIENSKCTQCTQDYTSELVVSYIILRTTSY